MTLTEFLLARIENDEDHADRAAFGWRPMGEPDVIEEWSTLRSDVTEHIARHDPARVLAECEAKRRILNLCDFEPDCDAAVLKVARVLAAVYADHPDYDEAWRPL